MDLHFAFLLILLLDNFLMLAHLIRQVLLQLQVLLLSNLKATSGIVTKLLNKLKSLNGFSFDLSVVTLHDFQVGTELVKLIV